MCTGGPSGSLDGTATTAPAGVTPPSEVGGKSVASAGVTTKIPFDNPSVMARDDLAGISSGQPTSHDVVIFSPSERTSSVMPSASDEHDLMPFLRIYTPPPTAPARHATWAISARPPHFGNTAPKPAPKTPMLRRCREILGNAVAVLTRAEGPDPSVKASSAPCEDVGKPNFFCRKSVNGVSASEFQTSDCSSYVCTKRKNFTSERLARRSKELSLKMSSRLLGTREILTWASVAPADFSSMNQDPTAWKSS